jgi:hypothetical protein
MVDLIWFDVGYVDFEFVWIGRMKWKVKENRVKRDKVCHRIMNEWEASANC